MISFLKIKTKKGLFILFSILFFSLLFFNTLPVKATEVQWPSLNLPGIGNLAITDSTTLVDLVKYIFYLSISISGLLAFAMLIYGGIRYLTSAGNPTAQKDGRDAISSALLGILLLLGSVLLLRLINPDILILNSPMLNL